MTTGWAATISARHVVVACYVFRKNQRRMRDTDGLYVAVRESQFLNEVGDGGMSLGENATLSLLIHLFF